MSTDINIDVYEQELFGATRWRVMRTDGLSIFGVLQLDLPTRDEARVMIEGESRRNKWPATIIHYHLLDRQSNGRRLIEDTERLGDA
jgi:hypothetical protein